MSEMKMLQRLTADVTVTLDPELETSIDGNPVRLRSLFIRMGRTKANRWTLQNVSGSGTGTLKRSPNQFRKAYYEVEGFTLTPEIQRHIADAMALVKEDCRKAS